MYCICWKGNLFSFQVFFFFFWLRNLPTCDIGSVVSKYCVVKKNIIGIYHLISPPPPPSGEPAIIFNKLSEADLKALKKKFAGPQDFPVDLRVGQGWWQRVTHDGLDSGFWSDNYVYGLTFAVVSVEDHPTAANLFVCKVDIAEVRVGVDVGGVIDRDRNLLETSLSLSLSLSLSSMFIVLHFHPQLTRPH